MILFGVSNAKAFTLSSSYNNVTHNNDIMFAGSNNYEITGGTFRVHPANTIGTREVNEDSQY